VERQEVKCMAGQKNTLKRCRCSQPIKQTDTAEWSMRYDTLDMRASFCVSFASSCEFGLQTSHTCTIMFSPYGVVWGIISQSNS
jgi:hypothetical protein